MSALYGKALARQIPDTTTGNQARLAFGFMTEALHGAYVTLGTYDPSGLSVATGLDAGAIEQAQGYLDDTNAALQKYFPNMPESDAALTVDQLAQLCLSVSISSTACQTIDSLFSTGFLAELSGNVIEACATVSGRVALAVSTVAGSFIGGTWWVWVLAGAALYLVNRYKQGTT